MAPIIVLPAKIVLCSLAAAVGVLAIGGAAKMVRDNPGEDCLEAAGKLAGAFLRSVSGLSLTSGTVTAALPAADLS
jgi:hypothetical protein